MSGAKLPRFFMFLKAVFNFLWIKEFQILLKYLGY